MCYGNKENREKEKGKYSQILPETTVPIVLLLERVNVISWLASS